MEHTLLRHDNKIKIIAQLMEHPLPRHDNKIKIILADVTIITRINIAVFLFFQCSYSKLLLCVCLSYIKTYSLCEYSISVHRPTWGSVWCNLQIVNKALESVMCDVIKIRINRRIATRSGKGNQPLNIKTAVERPIFKLGLPNFMGSFYLFYFSLHPSILDVFFMTSHMTFSSAS